AAMGGTLLLLATVVALVLASAWRTSSAFPSLLPTSRRRRIVLSFGAVVALSAVMASGGWLVQRAAAEPPPAWLEGEPLLSLARRSSFGVDGAGELERRRYRPAAEFDRRNVILFMLDAVRADHLPLYGYERDTTPFLTSL